MMTLHRILSSLSEKLKEQETILVVPVMLTSAAVVMELQKETPHAVASQSMVKFYFYISSFL